MNQFRIRWVRRIAVLSVALPLVACSAGPQAMNDKTFHFDVTFARDAQGRATAVQVTPNPPQQGIYVGGNAVISVPQSGKYKVEWSSKEDFSMKFETIIADTAPAHDKDKKIGDESKTWTTPKNSAHVNLKNGIGSGKETVVSKYWLKDARSGAEFDPVIIIDR